VVRAELGCQGRLFGAPCDGGDAITQLVGLLHPEMAQAADALNSHQCVWLNVQVAQCIKRRDAGAQQRRRVQRFQRVRNPDQAAGAGVDDLGVTAVFGGARLWLVLAVHKIAPTAPLAFAAMTTQETQADAITDLPRGDAVADRVDHADDLVARHDRPTWVVTHALDAKHVAVADPAGMRPEPHVTRAGRHRLAIHLPDMRGTSTFRGLPSDLQLFSESVSCGWPRARILRWTVRTIQSRPTRTSDADPGISGSLPHERYCLFRFTGAAGFGAPVRVCVSQRDGEETRIDLDQVTAFFSKFPETAPSDVPGRLDTEMVKVFEDAAA
jgi:hypothetical protein